MKYECSPITMRFKPECSNLPKLENMKSTVTIPLEEYEILKKSKVSTEQKAPPIANVMLGVGLSSGHKIEFGIQQTV